MNSLRFRFKSAPEYSETLLRELLREAVSLGVRRIHARFRNAPDSRTLELLREAGLPCSFTLPAACPHRFPAEHTACAVCSERDLMDLPSGFGAALTYSDALADETARLWRLAENTGHTPELLCEEGDFRNPAPEAFGRFLRGILPVGHAVSMPFPKNVPCGNCFDSVLIDESGTVLPCAGCTLELGRITEKPLSAILTSSRTVEYLGEARKRVKAPCAKCGEFGTCFGCRGRAHRYAGDVLAADPGCFRNVDRRNEIACLPAENPADWLPHQGRMLLVNVLRRLEDRCGYAEARVTAENPFLDGDGRVHPAGLAEMAAQGLAFLNSFLNPGSCANGILAEITSFERTGACPKVGDTLYLMSEELYKMEPWHVGGFTVRAASGELLAKGEVKVCQTETPLF